MLKTFEINVISLWYHYKKFLCLLQKIFVSITKNFCAIVITIVRYLIVRYLTKKIFFVRHNENLCFSKIFLASKVFNFLFNLFTKNHAEINCGSDLRMAIMLPKTPLLTCGWQFWQFWQHTNI